MCTTDRNILEESTVFLRENKGQVQFFAIKNVKMWQKKSQRDEASFSFLSLWTLNLQMVSVVEPLGWLSPVPTSFNRTAAACHTPLLFHFKCLIDFKRLMPTAVIAAATLCACSARWIKSLWVTGTLWVGRWFISQQPEDTPGAFCFGVGQCLTLSKQLPGISCSVSVSFVLSPSYCNREGHGSVLFWRGVRWRV